MSKRSCACTHVVLAVKRGRHDGGLLRYAAARAALWLLLDLPASVETLLFPDHSRNPVRSLLLCSDVWPYDDSQADRRQSTLTRERGG